MEEFQALIHHHIIRLADTEFMVRILLNGTVYFEHPSGGVYQETALAGVPDTGVRYLSEWNNNNVFFHEGGNPYSYIVLGTKITDITKNFTLFGKVPSPQEANKKYQ